MYVYEDPTVSTAAVVELTNLLTFVWYEYRFEQTGCLPLLSGGSYRVTQDLSISKTPFRLCKLLFVCPAIWWTRMSFSSYDADVQLSGKERGLVSA